MVANDELICLNDNSGYMTFSVATGFNHVILIVTVDLHLKNFNNGLAISFYEIGL